MPRRVVILKASRIGDFICATPAMRALRSTLPDAEFTLITLPMLKDMAERLPYIDHYAEFPGYPGIAEQFFQPGRAARFFANMQEQHFDLAVQFQGTGVYSNPFILMLGACQSAGFIRHGDPPGLLSAALPWPERGHEIQRNLALTDFCGTIRQGESVDFPLNDDDHEKALKLLADARRPWFGLHPSARQNTRRWPIERFIEAGRRLQQKYGGSIILIGEKEDRISTGRALQDAGISHINLAGMTSIPTLGAIIAHLDVLITNDTGPAHIAYALQAPVVTIFGSGDPERYGPIFPGPFQVLVHPVLCRPCGYEECPIGYKCLDEIGVDKVVRATESVMRRI